MTELVYTGQKSCLLREFLQRQYPALTTGGIAKGLKTKAIRKNGEKASYQEKLLKGDRVQLFLPEALLLAQPGPSFLRARPGLLPVFEDESLLIVNKPAGVLSEGDEADTMLNRCRLFVWEASGPDAAEKVQLCHRLDTGTSGLLMAAKSPEAFAQMSDAMQRQLLQKTYRCITLGSPPMGQGTLTGYLTKEEKKGLVLASDAPLSKKSKWAQTQYRVLQEKGGVALVEIELITGRTHQIRVHMAHLGCPVLGDSKYGSNQANRAYRLKYQALCARRLRFLFKPGDYPLLNGLAQKEVCCPPPWFEEAFFSGELCKAKEGQGKKVPR